VHTRTAYLPLSTYPESPVDNSILAAVNFVISLKCALHVTTFAINIPQMRSPLGDLLLDVPALVRATEEKSMTDCLRLQDLVQKAFGSSPKLDIVNKKVVLGAAVDAAASEARFYDFSVIPLSQGSLTQQELAEAVIFGSGRPTILLEQNLHLTPLDHIAIAWDASRVAARALWDALAFLPRNGRITVLTIADEKPLSGSDLAGSLAALLEKRGYNAKAHNVTLGERTIAEALQLSALEAGAQLLAMGGFGHSRIRDFVLGGATKGVLNDLRLPVLLSH
jgi:nucleotide-binding universal stress UspA family protein